MSMSTAFYCEICGASTMSGQHRCKETVLRAIDAANTRAGDREFQTTLPEPFHRTEGRRLAEGFALLNLSNRDEG